MLQNKDQELIKRNARTGLVVLGIVILMVCVSFAAVPLYTLFCKVTGFGGTTRVASELPDTVLDRTVRVNFNADTAPHFPWVFDPEQRFVEIQLGAQGLASYTARNTAGIPVSGTAIFNVTPLKAGKYFHKIQCFCFDEQTLNPGQEVSMPVLFYVDPALDDDPLMDDVHTITLSYTFFPADSKALEEALEAFYNGAEIN